ncbi:hypothetical protein [Enterococcus nangangensis]|uniref:hypothetical protein n=1 Tax=Enterococcus nangangensis TaxID=2559926 RepID=UPI0010F528AF|nr:hypothetical protein [Enterococcus nangangensis]
MLAKNIHRLMLLLTFIVLGITYYLDFSGFVMVLLISLPASLTGYLFAKHDAHLSVESFKKQY